ncbi:MAG TPA: PLP-dependent aminotransferase family protein [Steroidobacteraceae bacterium]|nr:PLP-dependent aminotransferase family protein [Steroidobacteraceae bacterium]
MTSRDRLREGFVPLATLDPAAGLPLRRQLYNWFLRAIADGHLRPGQRVPSTRRMARELTVSRITVLWAYEQLTAEGYLQTTRGSGAVIARSIPPPVGSDRMRVAGAARSPGRKVQVSRQTAKLLRLGEEQTLPIIGAFRNAPALDLFPRRAWSRLVSRRARKSAAADMGYGDPMGEPALRAAIAEYLGAVRDARCDESQVMITAGSQQALQIALRALLNPGDRVWMEEPGYPGAHRALLLAGCEPVPVPTDAEGLIVARGVHKCASARGAYVTPSHQYPLGMTLSASRRFQLLNWAQRADAWIFEDDYDSEYRFAGKPVSSLHGLDSDARVIYMGTFSKVCFPALRIGYLILPHAVVPAFRAVRDAIDIFPPTLYQQALADFIREGHFARHIRRMGALYAERRECLLHALARHFGEAVEIVGATAGMHLVVLLPRGMDDESTAARLRAAGIACSALSACCLERPRQGGLILGYGGVASDQIDESVRRLARIAQPVRQDPR